MTGRLVHRALRTCESGKPSSLDSTVMSMSMQANANDPHGTKLRHMPGRAASWTGSSPNEKMNEERHDANTCTHEEAPKEKDNLGWKQLAELLQARLDAAAKERADLAEQVEALKMKLGESQQLLVVAEARAQAAEGLLQDISEELRCPLTLARFRHPVVASDGNTYERAAIRRWARRQPTSGSPLTREPLEGHMCENRLAAKVGRLLPAAGLPSDGEESDSASEPEELPPAPESQVPRAWGPSLHESIHAGQEAAALRLLQAPQVLGLNILQDRMSVLMMAIDGQLWEVVRAILARPDFRQMNAGEEQWTALHEAAAQGHLWLCRAICELPDFVALGALDNQGRTAADVAADFGHEDLADFLTSAMEAA